MTNINKSRQKTNDPKKRLCPLHLESMRAEWWRAGHNKRFSTAKLGYKERQSLSLKLQFKSRHRSPLHLEGPFRPVTENSPRLSPLQVHLLLLLSSNIAVNPAQSFITKARENKMFWWYPLGSGCKLDREALLQRWVKLPTIHTSLMRSSLLPSIADLLVGSSAAFGSTRRLPCPSYILLRKLRHLALNVEV